MEVEMIAPKIPAKYLKVWRSAVPYFKYGRKGDEKHSREIAEQVYEASKGKKWDLDVLMPVAIFHDIGHAAILPEHLWMVTGPKKLKGSKLVHMLTGAKMASDALEKINYPKAKIKRIVEIISVHDLPEAQYKNEAERAFSDIDKLIRFKPEGFKEVLDDFGIKAEVALPMLEDEVMPKIQLVENREKAKNYLADLKAKYNKK